LPAALQRNLCLYRFLPFWVVPESWRAPAAAWFEMYPSWEHSLDANVFGTAILKSVNQLALFEHPGIYAAKVLNASSVGSHSFWLRIRRAFG